MPFPVPRCCGDCARSGRLAASPRAALRRVPVAAGEKAAARAGAQDSGMRLNATTWSAHGKLQNRLGIQSGIRLRPPVQQAAATMPPHALTRPADAWCISPVRRAGLVQDGQMTVVGQRQPAPGGGQPPPTQCRQRQQELRCILPPPKPPITAVGPTICLASAKGNATSPLALRASAAPRHYRKFAQSALAAPLSRRFAPHRAGSDGTRSRRTRQPTATRRNTSIPRHLPNKVARQAGTTTALHTAPTHGLEVPDAIVSPQPHPRLAVAV